MIPIIISKEVLAKGRALPDGTIRDWKGKKHIKKQGKWVPYREQRGKTSSGGSTSSELTKRSRIEMKITDLTEKQMEIIADNRPDWMADHRPDWMVSNHPDWMISNRPDWMADHRPGWMAINYPDWMMEHRPDWMADHRPDWMVSNHPDWMAENRPDWDEVPENIVALIEKVQKKAGK